MVNNIIGFMLMDAPYSALNNAGNDAGDRTDNIVKVKTITKYTNNSRKTYPYVSGQALRYWWRDTLEKQFNWKLSPVNRDKKIAFTEANPITYPDDDVFGYMRAMKKKDGGTVTRISSLKNSPLISVVNQTPTRDFGVMSRQNEGDPVPYEHEFYSTILKGIFALDISSLGVFSESEKTGYHNMYPHLIEEAENEGLTHEGDEWKLDKETRIRRASDVIEAIPYISGGAKNTSHLTDVSPKLIILSSISTGNNIFMNIVYEDEENSTWKFDINALDDVLSDYSDKLTSKIYIGMRKGFLPELYTKLEEYANNNENVEFGSIKGITDKFTENIKELI